jgi:hypothetical protein
MEAWVVMRKTLDITGKPVKEFKRLFSSAKAAESYIECGKRVKIESAKEEFVELHGVRDS